MPRQTHTHARTQTIKTINLQRSGLQLKRLHIDSPPIAFLSFSLSEGAVFSFCVCVSTPVPIGW